MFSETDPKSMSAQQVGKYLRISLSTVHHLTRTGQLKAEKQGKKWVYLRSEIERFLDEGFSEWLKEPVPVNSEERRAYPRLICSLQGQMRSEGNGADDPVWGRILNISQQGLLFETDEHRTDSEAAFGGRAQFFIAERVHGATFPYVLNGLIVRREAVQDGTVRLGVHLDTSALLLLENLKGLPASN